MGLVCDTPPNDGEHVCLVTWESYNAWLRIGPEKVVLSYITHFDL